MADPKNRMSRYLRFSTMGLELGLSVIVGLLVGQWLDSVFDTEPWLLLLFLIFGMIAGFRSVYRLLRELNQDAASSREDGNASGSQPPSNRSGKSQ